MEKYYISVIMPAYNASKFIESTILSIVNQPVKVELIIINDGSNDDTDRICSELLKKYDNIVYKVVKNGGAGRARNIGMSIATGKFIMFIDSDDLYYENSIDEDFVEKIKKYDAKGIDVILSCKSITNEEATSKPYITEPESLIDIKYHMPAIEFWTCIIRKSYIEEKDVTFFEYREQDIETAFRYKVFSRTSKVVSDSTILFYLQRNNLESNTHTFNYYNLYSIKTKVYYELEKEWRKYTLDEKSDRGSNSFLKREVLHWAFEYFNYIKNNGLKKEYKKQMKEIVELVKSLSLFMPWQFYDTSLKDVVNYYRYYFKIKALIREIKKHIESL